tara:strand:+ start:337 stop:1275 length:939 start_codon:yes stop_codon:yes gene_type:complete
MNLLLIFLGFFLLVIGGEFIVRSSVALSLKLNISKFVIGMTVVSFATSLPELIVSVNAALNNSPSIAINNVVGSNIANIGIVLGLISILSNVQVDKKFLNRDWPVMFIFSALLFLFTFNDFILTQLEGLIFFILILAYIYYFLKKPRYKTINNTNINLQISSVTNFKICLWIILSILSLYFGAEFLVGGAVDFAKQINISEAVISVTIIAIGTSIPELAASLVAIAKNEEGLSVGNLIGSNIFNIGSVLGITAIIKPILITDEILYRDIVWMLIFAILIFILAITPEKNKISNYKGTTLFLAYIYFVYVALV